MDSICKVWKKQKEFLSKMLELPNRIPSADTFRRVMSGIDPIEWQESFMEWSQALKRKDKQVIAVDGKRLRGASKALGGQG